MKRVAVSTILVATALLSGGVFLPTIGAAADAEPTTRIEVTLFGGYRSGGKLEQTTGLDADGNPIKVDASLKKGSSYGVALNWEAEENSFFELAYSRQGSTLKTEAPIDVTVEYLQIGGYVITTRPEAKVVPYFVLTVGMGRLSPDDSELEATSKFAAAIGGGVKIAFTPHIAMRLDARLYGMFLGNENNLLCGGSGGATCKVQLQGDMLVQPDISVGFTYGF